MNSINNEHFHLKASEQLTVMINVLYYSREMEKQRQGATCPKSYSKSLGEPGKLSKTTELCSSTEQLSCQP